MLRLYPLIILVQIFCLYHAYKNQSGQKWFWIIIIFPFIGSLFYIYDQFYNRRNLENIKEGVKETLIGNYAINKLEQKVKFSDTHSNKMELAIEHMNVGNLNRAAELFESCYQGSYTSDAKLNMKLLQVNYLKEDYDAVLKYGGNLLGEKEFKHSEEKAALAWAYHKVGNSKQADALFKQLDSAHCNYDHRLEYAYFLEASADKHKAMAKLEELLDEIDAMDTYEKKLNKKSIKDIKYFYKHLSQQSKELD